MLWISRSYMYMISTSWICNVRWFGGCQQKGLPEFKLLQQLPTKAPYYLSDPAGACGEAITTGSKHNNTPNIMIIPRPVTPWFTQTGHSHNPHVCCRTSEHVPRPSRTIWVVWSGEGYTGSMSKRLSSTLHLQTSYILSGHYRPDQSSSRWNYYISGLKLFLRSEFKKSTVRIIVHNIYSSWSSM